MLVLVCVTLIASLFLYGNGESSLFAWSLYSLLWGAFFFFGVNGKKGILLGIAFALTFFIGGYRLMLISFPEPMFGEGHIQATILSVDTRLDKTILTVREDKHRAKVQLHTRSSDFLPGDRVSAEGELQKPAPFLTDTGRMFDYGAYLQSRGVTGVMFQAEVKKYEEQSSSLWLRLTRIATTIRFFIADTLSDYVTFPFDGVISGTLVGYQGGIPDSISDTFQKTGLLHMLVLSGYNITMLGGIIGILLRKFPLVLKNISIAIGVLLLVLVSGAGVSAIRAGMMGIIGILATSSRNQYDAFRALSITFLLFFIISPLSIMYDPGFHLSFLATFFLIMILPKIMPLFLWIPSFKSVALREYVALMLGIAFFMMPYLLYFSGTFPVITPFANALVGPLVPLFMLFGVVIVVVSPIPTLAGMFGEIVSLLGNIALDGIKYFSTFPQYNTPPFSLWVVVVFYGGCIVFLFWKEIVKFMKTLR